jgi:formylglycine-generating enzyme required for sulfatase activity
MPREIQAIPGKRALIISIAVFFTLAALIAAILAYLAWRFPNMVHVDGGEFQMGCSDCLDDEQPVHTVQLSDFKIARYETTNGPFVTFLNQALAEGQVEVEKEGSTYTKVLISGERAFDLSMPFCQISYANNRFAVKDGKNNFPALVSWYGAVRYCDSIDGRLPTEAEWEYAAKGGHLLNADFRYSGSDDADAVAWHRLNSAGSSHPVGEKQKNQIDVYDMSGNLREWVNDWYDPQYYANSPSVNPQGPPDPVQLPDGRYAGKIMRGGSWRENTYHPDEEYDRIAAVDRPRVRVTKRDYG